MNKSNAMNKEIAGQFTEPEPESRDDFLSASRVCEWCEGSGIKQVPNGPDDYDQEFCHCDVGVRAEMEANAPVLA